MPLSQAEEFAGLEDPDKVIVRSDGTAVLNYPAPNLAEGLHNVHFEIEDNGGNRASGFSRWSCPLCYANCDHSTTAPVLNVNDFICFTNRFAAGDPRANCDRSTTPPVLNVNDFVCFMAHFAAGC